MRICQVHRFHVPIPLRVEVHHIQPRAMGGLSTPDNLVHVCPNCHFDIHHFLTLLLKGKTDEFASIAGYRKEKHYALLGYERWIKAGRPGTPVYQVQDPYPDL